MNIPSSQIWTAHAVPEADDMTFLRQSWWSVPRHCEIPASARQQTYYHPSVPQQDHLPFPPGEHKGTQPVPSLGKVSHLRCDLVLIKVRKMLELCKDIFSCWECFWLALFPLLPFLSTYQSWENQKTVLNYLPHQKRTRPQTSAPASLSAWPAPVMQHRQKAQVPDLKLIRTVLNSKQ